MAQLLERRRQRETAEPSSVPGYRPILKWAGGKARLVPAILARLPSRIGTYHEPFVGGAAVFFALAGERRFRRAVLSDLNRDLVDVYRGVQSDVERVIRRLEEYRKRHDRETYYETRALDPSQLDLVERAARLIYLNKTGYNGLYRVNRAGQFNVPFGRYENPPICDAERLRAAAQALAPRRVSLEVADFDAVTERARRGDAVYLDPPYVPLSTTANFTAYHSEAFGKEAHQRLAETLAQLTRSRVSAVLSNSDTRWTRRLYDRELFQIDRVLVTRPINSKAIARGNVAELLVSNLLGVEADAVPRRRSSRSRAK
ncbi:MAG TPA: Dam family site-specific DNA-(adenine-N6)-methyltransferase [Polyangiaceae bacterium]|nr:Dam family site-specific DNA-(adenine-N6)-methyltransferase [Polyangiaceae bacterium]